MVPARSTSQDRALIRRVDNTPEQQINPAPLAGVDLRLEVARRLFSHFAQIRGRYEIDSDSQQILLAYKLSGLAEAARQDGGQARFDAEAFKARLNASTIADMTGIPRETVRRKLIKLAAQGLLTNEGQGFFVMDRYWPELDIVELLSSLGPDGQAAPPNKSK